MEEHPAETPLVEWHMGLSVCEGENRDDGKKDGTKSRREGKKNEEDSELKGRETWSGLSSRASVWLHSFCQLN